MREQPDSVPSLDVRWALDEACDAYETRLRAGERPRLEEFLADHAEPTRGHLFRELVKLDRAYRPGPDEDYDQRFPEYAADAYQTTPFREPAQPAAAGLPALAGYEILSRLGEGAMGVVYKAHHLGFKQFVALKWMRSGPCATAEERHRFRFEAEAAAALYHPNIVPLYDCGEIDGQAYLVLKYLDGGSLADRLKDRPLPPEDAAQLLATVADAVQHAHDRGILHRDLKPGNILLDGDDQPHVADFGLARHTVGDRGQTHTGAVLGTPSYMAPEQARGEKGLTVRADIYALGAVLYEMLTGAPPFKGDTVQQTLSLVLSEQAVTPPRLLNPNTPADLEAICQTCLEKTPADRYPTAAAVALDLRSFLVGEPVSVKPPGFWDWLVQALRTHPQPSPDYTWSAPVWIGVLVFVQQLVVSVLVETDAPVGVVWAAMLSSWLGMFLALWLLILRRFRLVPATERQSTVAAMGHVLAQVVLLWSVCPPTAGGSCQPVLALYPPLAVVSGLCWLILGSTNWGRLMPVGLATFGLALVMAAWPDVGPPLYGATTAFCLVWWGLAKRRYFVPRQRSGPD